MSSLKPSHAFMLVLVLAAAIALALIDRSKSSGDTKRPAAEGASTPETPKADNPNPTAIESFPYQKKAGVLHVDLNGNASETQVDLKYLLIPITSASPSVVRGAINLPGTLSIPADQSLLVIHDGKQIWYADVIDGSKPSAFTALRPREIRVSVSGDPPPACKLALVRVSNPPAPLEDYLKSAQTEDQWADARPDLLIRCTDKDAISLAATLNRRLAESDSGSPNKVIGGRLLQAWSRHQTQPFTTTEDLRFSSLPGHASYRLVVAGGMPSAISPPCEADEPMTEKATQVFATQRTSGLIDLRPEGPFQAEIDFDESTFVKVQLSPWTADSTLKYCVLRQRAEGRTGPSSGTKYSTWAQVTDSGITQEMVRPGLIRIGPVPYGRYRIDALWFRQECVACVGEAFIELSSSSTDAPTIISAHSGPAVFTPHFKREGLETTWESLSQELKVGHYVTECELRITYSDGVRAQRLRTFLLQCPLNQSIEVFGLPQGFVRTAASLTPAPRQRGPELYLINNRVSAILPSGDSSQNDLSFQFKKREPPLLVSVAIPDPALKNWAWKIIVVSKSGKWLEAGATLQRTDTRVVVEIPGAGTSPVCIVGRGTRPNATKSYYCFEREAVIDGSNEISVVARLGSAAEITTQATGAKPNVWLRSMALVPAFLPKGPWDQGFLTPIGPNHIFHFEGLIPNLEYRLVYHGTPPNEAEPKLRSPEAGAVLKTDL